MTSLISAFGYSQPSCNEPDSASFLHITYFTTPSIEKLTEDEYLRYDTISADHESKKNGLYYIPINQNDTTEIVLESDKGKMIFFLIDKNNLIEEPVCLLIKGIPKRAGRYIIHINKDKRQNFLMTCCNNITPENWELVRSKKL